MATPRKPRPSFDAPAASTPEASAWAYRTDPTAPATPPAPPVRTVTSASASASARTTPSVLNRVVTTPVMLAALIVLMPLTWIARPSKPR